MPANKKMKKGDKFRATKAQAEHVDKVSKAMAYPADQGEPAATAKKSGGGRPATVDYKRESRINVCVTQELNDRLGKAVAMEGGKRHPDRVDKGLIIEEALTAWFKKKGY